MSRQNTSRSSDSDCGFFLWEVREMYKFFCVCMLATMSLAAQAPPVLTLSPSTGEGLEADLALTVSAPNGVGSLTEVRLMIKQDMTAGNDCFLVHYPGSATVELRSDSGSAFGSPVAFGGWGSDSNSQCAVYGKTSVVQATLDTYYLKLHLHFAKKFAGLRRIWAQVVDRNDPDASRWMLLGEWVVPEVAKFPGRIDRIKASAGTSSIELSSTPAPAVEPRVYRNGLLLAPFEDYTLEGPHVRFLQPIRQGDFIQVAFQPSCSAP
jgi:hypothetical protein